MNGYSFSTLILSGVLALIALVFNLFVSPGLAAVIGAAAALLFMWMLVVGR